jgi:hypothetical protein
MCNGKRSRGGKQDPRRDVCKYLNFFFFTIYRSPAHPGLMATASSNGTIGLWNFALSLEEPITGSDGIVVEPDAGSGRGLNKLKWSSDGRRLLVASADRVHALVLAEDVVRQKGDEDSRMMNHLLSRGLLDRSHNPEPSLMA